MESILNGLQSAACCRYCILVWPVERAEGCEGYQHNVSGGEQVQSTISHFPCHGGGRQVDLDRKAASVRGTSKYPLLEDS